MTISTIFISINKLDSKGIYSRYHVTQEMVTVKTEVFLFTVEKRHFKAVVPNLLGTRDQFRGRQFFHRLGCGLWGGWFMQ